MTLLELKEIINKYDNPYNHYNIRVYGCYGSVGDIETIEEDISEKTIDLFSDICSG